MNRIRKLPDSLVSKIAAGEVIERPFSAVKELVENSIDAGSKNIQIEVEEGGRKKITVIDDGEGMSREDALLALERHATSKIDSEEDLFRIRTLGFRGEALPSIASISLMTLETLYSGGDTALPPPPPSVMSGSDRSLRLSGRNESDPDNTRSLLSARVGVRIEIEGGKITKTTISPISRGTRISVQNLFFNTPARQKFMKSRETEFSHIAGWVEAIALSKADIGFSLRHNGKVELKTGPQSEARGRIRDILGAEITEFLHPVSSSRNRMELSGFVSDHRASGTSAKSLFFFVNGRLVRDRTLQHAVLSSYENLLMKHRYPWVVLFLTIPPDLVDVNVHPTKSEVRFANGALVHDFVREGLLNGLRGASGTLSQVPAELAQDLSAISLRSTASLREIAPFKGGAQTGPRDLQGEGEVRIIGQVHGTYLVCETGDKLILIDQHAAHERIGFEKLKRQYEEGGIARQQLLIPQNFDLRPSQGEVLKKYLDDLAKVGLEIEFFGGNTFILRTIPTLLEGTDLISLIEELIESLQSFEKLTPLEERIHEVLEQMACHAQVRAGDRLSNEEIASLIEQLDKNRTPLQCPHGRPSVLEVPFGEVERWFKRRN